jgi:hypothetical protein
MKMTRAIPATTVNCKIIFRFLVQKDTLCSVRLLVFQNFNFCRHCKRAFRDRSNLTYQFEIASLRPQSIMKQ